jgi:MFS transporter, PPP family, 3-phenylpropionic acid transporter
MSTSLAPTSGPFAAAAVVPARAAALKGFYACFFICHGVTIPFFPSYLRGLGLGGSQVALMMAVAPLFHLAVPLGWGWLADRTRKPHLLLRVACAAAALLMVPVAGLRALPALLALYAAHQLFAVPIGSLTDSLTLDRLRRTGGEYSRIRLWGSASFLAVCAGVGPLIDARARSGGDPLVPALIAAGFGLAALVTFGLRGESGRPAPRLGEMRALLSSRRFLFILTLGFLHWAALTPQNGFYGILMVDRGFGAGAAGRGFFVAMLAEVAAFAVYPHLARRFRLETLLVVAAAGSSLRWLLTAGALGPLPAPALLAVQVLHALTFALFWASALAWLGQVVPPGLRATGQALFTAVTFGLGSLVGFLACGWLYDRTGGAETAFLAATLLQLGPLALAIAARRRSTFPH